MANFLSQVFDFLFQPVYLVVFGREKFIYNFLGNMVGHMTLILVSEAPYENFHKVLM